MVTARRIIGFLTLVTVAAACQDTGGFSARGQSKPAQQVTAGPSSSPAEDISGMYTFLKDGEFVQINVEKDAAKTVVSGYISRMGNSESDDGVFMDQFFDHALIQGHEVSFTTKVLHGIWFEFKGKFDRGPAKSKAQDGYYIVRGTLKELSLNPDKTTASRSRDVEFKLLAQPDDSDQAAPAKGKKPK